MEELYRQFACVCENCVTQKFEECFLPERNIVSLFLLPRFDKAKWHSFVANLKIPYLTQKTLRMILMRKCITRKQASLLVKMDDIAGVKTNGAHSYYLVKRSCQSYITEQIEKDSYSHTFPANHNGHY